MPSTSDISEIVDIVRLIFRDKAENNILLGDVQFSDEEVENAVKMTAAEFNSMPPTTSMSWRLIPEDILFLGVATWLLLSESFLQLRNQVSIPTDGLGVVGVDDKTQFYQQLRGQLKQEFTAKCRAKKNEMNIAAGFGSLSSGYVNVSRFTNS